MIKITAKKSTGKGNKGNRKPQPREAPFQPSKPKRVSPKPKQVSQPKPVSSQPSQPRQVRSSRPSFGTRANAIIGGTPQTANMEKYLSEVSEAYNGYRNTEFNSVVQSAYKQVQVSPSMATIATFTFSELDSLKGNLESRVGDFLRNRLKKKTGSTEDSGSVNVNDISSKLANATNDDYVAKVVKGIAEYGVKHKLSAADAVNSAEARLNGVMIAYGSLEAYEQKTLDDIDKWNGRFTKFNISGGPGTDLFKSALNFGTSKLGRFKVASVVLKGAQALSDKGQEYTVGVSKFGLALVKAYTDRKDTEIKQYHRIDKAI